MKKPSRSDALSRKPARAEPIAKDAGTTGSDATYISAKDRHLQKEERGLSRVAGISAVRALFANAPERVLRLFYEDRMKLEVGAYCAVLAKTQRPYRLVAAEELTRIAGTSMHGGVVAVAKTPTITLLNLAKTEAWAHEGKPLLILDGVSNPHNFGAIARTAAFFGIPRILLSDNTAQAGLSDASFRVAEGGLEYIELYRVGLFVAALKKLGDFYHVVAAAPGQGYTHPEKMKSGSKPFALVMGNEEHGLSDATLKACQTIVAIPALGHIQSLNVSASAAILLYAISARR